MVNSSMKRRSGRLVPFVFSETTTSITEMLDELSEAGFNVNFEESRAYESIVADGVVTANGRVFVVKDLLDDLIPAPYCSVSPTDDGGYIFDMIYNDDLDFIEEQLEYTIHEMSINL